MIMNNIQGRIWKEVLMGFLKVLSHLLGETEENDEKV
jgi:hypothetical protein